MILIGAGLVIKSLWRLGRVEPGMEIERLLTFRVTPPRGTYPTTAELAPVIAHIEERLSAAPGVQSAGGISDLPMSGAVNSVTARRDDLPPPAPGEGLVVLIRAVTPTYLPTVGIAVRRGRNVEPTDRQADEMVMIVNTALAERLFPGEDPVGHRVTTLGVSRRIIGVVNAVRQFGPARPGEPGAYIPYAQTSGNEWLRRSVTFFLRTTGDPGGLAATVRQAVGAVDPTIPVNDVQAMATVLATNVAAPRFRSLAFGLFAALALTLAAVGIGGVMAFNLSQRSREIAIRLAIGAEPRMVLRLLLRQGARLTMLGAAVGLGASVWLSRLLAAFLFGVDPRDLGVFASVILLLAGVGMLATYLPARRATAIAPATVLRGE